MFGRRVPPNVVFLLSLLLAVVCGFVAYHAYLVHNIIGMVVAVILAIWFAVDAVRSYSWTKRRP